MGKPVANILFSYETLNTSPKIRYKARVLSLLTTSTQNFTGDPS